MKTGRTINELAAEITRQNQTKKDYIASTGVMRVEATELGNTNLVVGDVGAYPINDLAHNQIAEHTGIPVRYYDRMRKEAPDLLANNIERWFQKYPAARMVRTLDGGTRAFLSDKFAPLDNFDFANATLPILADRNLNVMSCEITEKRIYLKAVDERLFCDVPVGYKMGDGSHQIFDTCAPAVILSNSEVGYGRLVVETGVYTRACTNMALFSSGGMKRTHVGARHTLLEGMDVADLDQIMSRLTKQRTMQALWMQVRDVLKAAFDEKVMARRIEAINAAAHAKITGRVDKVLEVVKERYSLNDDEHGSVLNHLISGGNLTQYGLHAAITRSAQDADGYDRATELEYLGGKVLELPRSEFEQLVAA